MLIRYVLLLALALCALPAGAIALRGATPYRAEVPCNKTMELTLDLQAEYENPFDPEQIDVYALFTPPDGQPMRVNAFYTCEYTRTLVNNVERLQPDGKPVWKIRFTPSTPGDWKYTITAKDRTGEASLPAKPFTVTPTEHHGFIRRGTKNPAGFVFADSKPYFPIGENMCWGGKAGSFDYDEWLPALSDAGGNWIRVWMCSWNCALEWKTGNGFEGAGRYNLANAARLDAILDAAAQNGVNVMLCLGTYGEFTTGGFFKEGQWKDNPYNAENGGPCARPEDFWTNETARKLYQRRLRYLAARYGSYTNLFAWELWNEAKAPAAWVGEMARFVKGAGDFAGKPADPYGHLLSTTYGDAEVWKLPEIDFTLDHRYGQGDLPDFAPVVRTMARATAAQGKPHLLSEFGIDWRKSDAEYDKNGLGVNLHNAIWAAMSSGDAGSAMIWWWDNYVHPRDLYGQFTALRTFADTVPWAERPWSALSIDPPQALEMPEFFTDLILPMTSGWGATPLSEFTINSRGVVGGSQLPSYLYSPNKPDLRSTPTFHVRYQQPGRFVLHIDTVSARCKVRILLDGKQVGVIALSADPPKDPDLEPEYESTEYKEEWKLYQARFNKDYGIDIPPGEHTITLDNAEGDWVSLQHIVLTNYRSSRYPDMRVYGQTNGRMAILWAQNARSNWQETVANPAMMPPMPPPPDAPPNLAPPAPGPMPPGPMMHMPGGGFIQGATAMVHGLPDGDYLVEWWDTLQGTITARDPVQCRDGALQLRFPAITTDIAARIVKQEVIAP